MQSIIILNIIFFLHLFVNNLYALDHNSYITNDISKSNWDGKFDVGEILIWPFSHIEPSENWIECNGDIINKIKYPKLNNFNFKNDKFFDFNKIFMVADSVSSLATIGRDNVEIERASGSFYFTINLRKNQIQNSIKAPINKRIKLSGKWRGHQVYDYNFYYGKRTFSANPNITRVYMPMPAWKFYPENVSFDERDPPSTISYIQPTTGNWGVYKWLTNSEYIIGNDHFDKKYYTNVPVIFVPGTSPTNENVPRHVYVRYFMRAR